MLQAAALGLARELEAVVPAGRGRSDGSGVGHDEAHSLVLDYKVALQYLKVVRVRIGHGERFFRGLVRHERPQDQSHRDVTEVCVLDRDGVAALVHAEPFSQVLAPDGEDPLGKSADRERVEPGEPLGVELPSVLVGRCAVLRAGDLGERLDRAQEQDCASGRPGRGDQVAVETSHVRA